MKLTILKKGSDKEHFWMVVERMANETKAENWESDVIEVSSKTETVGLV